MRAFRESLGITPYQYILVERIALAERLLLTRDLPISVIASMSGFTGNAHLTTTMRRLRGYVPSELRRGRTHRDFRVRSPDLPGAEG